MVNIFYITVKNIYIPVIYIYLISRMQRRQMLHLLQREIDAGHQGFGGGALIGGCDGGALIGGVLIGGAKRIRIPARHRALREYMKAFQTSDRFAKLVSNFQRKHRFTPKPEAKTQIFNYEVKRVSGFSDQELHDLTIAASRVVRQARPGEIVEIEEPQAAGPYYLEYKEPPKPTRRARPKQPSLAKQLKAWTERGRSLPECFKGSLLKRWAASEEGSKHFKIPRQRRTPRKPPSAAQLRARAILALSGQIRKEDPKISKREAYAIAETHYPKQI